MGLILSKLSCYKLQPKPVTPRLFQMIYSIEPRSPSFSTLHTGNKGSVVQDTESIVEAGLYMGLGQCEGGSVNVFFLLLSIHSAWVKLVSSEFQTCFWCWKMIIQHILAFGGSLTFFSMSSFYHATISSTTTPPTPALPASKTWVILYVKKFLRMINMNSSTENHLIQLWMDPSGE